MELSPFAREVADLVRSVGFRGARIEKFWVEDRELHILVTQDIPPSIAGRIGLFPFEPTLPDVHRANARRVA